MMLARLQAIARGTQPPKVLESGARAQQCKRRLAEAVMLARAGRAAPECRDYIGHLG